MAHPEGGKALPFVVAKTLGAALGSVHLAGILPAFAQMSRSRQEEAARAGFPAGPEQGLDIFRAILTHPEGVLVGVRTPEASFREVATPNGRIQLHNPEVEDWIRAIDPAEEEAQLRLPAEFPLILMAGRHMDTNANTDMRDPKWNEGRRACTLAMHHRDAEALGLADGQMVRVVTEAGQETIEVEVTAGARQGPGRHPARVRPRLPGRGPRRQREPADPEHSPRLPGDAAPPVRALPGGAVVRPAPGPAAPRRPA